MFAESLISTCAMYVPNFFTVILEIIAHARVKFLFYCSQAQTGWANPSIRKFNWSGLKHKLEG